MENNLIYLSPYSPIFQVSQKVLRDHFKDYSAEKIEKTVNINNLGKLSGTYKYIVEWQSEDQSSFDIFKVIGE